MDTDAREYISLIFDGYMKRKKEKRLYVHDDVPKIIIKTYYSIVEKPDFSKLMNNFKRRYMYNENKLEQVHTKEECLGLNYAYDYILENKDSENISIYDLSWIHERLYSKTPYPEMGGKYRTEERYLLGLDKNGNMVTGNVELTPPWLITREMNEQNKFVKELVNQGLKLKEKKKPDELIDYILKCVKLNCNLIKIHPFGDGNGRAIRVFTNLLFSLASIPPIYIENKEKEKYQEAMNNALVQDNYKDINDFYLFKICDSIITLDINYQEEIEHSHKRSK